MNAAQRFPHVGRLNARLCSFNTDTLTAVVEASDLGLSPAYVGEQLYPDACDVGIALRNPGTGSVTVWCLADERMDDERELIALVYRPVSETLRDFPHLAGWELHVLND